MALIKCPECGKEISDKAKQCVHCGYDIISNEAKVDDDKKDLLNNEGDVKKVKKSNSSRTKKILLIVSGIIIGVLAIFAILPCSHEWQGATCTTPKTCQKCDETEGDALGHTKGEWKLTKEATLTDVGVEEQLCSVCGESLDSRGTEKKTAKVKNGIFNFNDKELVDWINSWEKNFEVDESKIHMDSLGEKNTCYKITLTATGSEGILILNHEKDIDGNVSAIMTYFDDYLESTAFISVVAKNVESDFSVDKAGENLIDNDMAYIIGDINVMRVNLSDEMEVTLLAPLEYMGTILSGTELGKNDCFVSMEKNNSDLLKYNNNVLKYMNAKYGEGSSYWFYHDDGDSTGVEDIGNMKTFRGISLGESSESDVINAYGKGYQFDFDKSTDILYLSIQAAGLDDTKYLEDTKKVIVYSYNDEYQLAMYIDYDEKVDFIAYLGGEWY